MFSTWHNIGTAVSGMGVSCASTWVHVNPIILSYLPLSQLDSVSGPFAKQVRLNYQFGIRLAKFTKTDKQASNADTTQLDHK